MKLTTCQVAYLPIRRLLYPILKNPHFAKRFFGKTGASRVAYREEVKSIVKSRLGAIHTSNAREDFFHHLMKASDKETGARLAPEELVSEATALIAAGNDTASACIASVFFYLLHNPRVLAKLVLELTSAFKDVEEIRFQGLQELTYLRAIIDEALRLSLPIPGLLARRVLPGGALIDGNHYPVGTIVGISAYVLHHHENYFPCAFSFIPERWISGPHDDTKFNTSPRAMELAKSAFSAFSAGPRGCIGKTMAYMEISITIARLLFLYDIRIPSSETPITSPKKSEDAMEYKLWDYFISDRQGPTLEFKKRKN